MEKKANTGSSRMIMRLLKITSAIAVLLMILIYIFTKSVFYSIIFCLGAIISTVGFMAMIKMTDRVLAVGKGRLLFMLAFFLKLAVILLSLYLVARLPGKAVWFHGLGLSIIVITITVEGFYQLYHSRNKSLDRSIVNG